MSMFRELLINNALSSKQIDYLNMPITLETLEADNTIKLNKYGSPTTITCFYKVNNGDWTSYVPDTTGGITLNNIGDKISFYCTTTTFSKNTSNCYSFSSIKNFKVYGNIMSLVQGDRKLTSLKTIEYQYQFYNLFHSCGTLIDSQNLQLPATNLAPSCYTCMFYYCISLQKPPKLPATNLADNCYSQMFKHCENISEVHMDFFGNNITNSTQHMFFCDPQFSRIIPEIYVKNITKTEFLNNNGFNIFATDLDFYIYTITTTVHAKDQTFSWTYKYENWPE